MRDIILSATRASWQLPLNHGTDTDKNPGLLKIKNKILERDDFTCYFCGFKAHKWQDIHHLNDNHSDFSEKNLVAVCCLCHQCHHLGLAGSSGGADLIWLPEFKQTELNHLLRMIFVARYNENAKIHNFAEEILMTINSRAVFVEQKLASGASNPSILGEVLLKMSPEQYKDRNESIKNLRLLAKPLRFSPQIKYWATELYKSFDPDKWYEQINESKLLKDVE